MRRKILGSVKVLGIAVAVFSVSAVFANYNALIAKIKKPPLKPSAQKNLPPDPFSAYIPPAQNFVRYADSAPEEPGHTQCYKHKKSAYLGNVFPAAGNTLAGNKADNKLSVKDNLKIIIQSLPEAVAGGKYNTWLTTKGGYLPYKWRLVSGMLPEGIYLDEEAGALFGIPQNCEVAVFTVKVTDDKDNFALFDFTLAVLKQPETANTGGGLSIITNSLPDAVVGKDYYKQILAVGGQGPYRWSIVSEALPEKLSLHKESGVLYGAPQKEEEGRFTVRVTGRKNDFAEARFSLSIKTSPLYITTGSLPEVYAGAIYSQRLEAQGGFPPYRWQIIAGSLPDGISFESHSALLLGVPQKSQKTTFKAKVIDAKQNCDIAEFMIKVNKSTLQIVTGSLETGVVGKNYYQPFYAQGGSPPYSWQITVYFPEGLILNEENGSISGTPLESADTMLDIVVTDAESRQAGANLRLIVLDEALTIEGPFLRETNVGREFYQVLCARGGSPPYIWKIVSGELPQGITLDGDSGILCGIPVKAQNVSANIEVTDSYSDYTSADFTFRILDAELSIITANLPSPEINENYSFYLEAQGGVLPYQWRIKSGSLPDGLTLNVQGLLSGIPKEKGNFSPEVEVIDTNAGSVSSSFLLTVEDNSLFIATDVLPEGAKGVEYYFVMQAGGGTEPYRWRIAAGGLPEGIILKENTGVLSGIPVRGRELSVIIEVEDIQGNIAQAAFVIKVTGDPLSILTTELTEGTTGEPYTQELSAEGGIQPYFWRVITGDFPEGISLNNYSGLISGLPENEADRTLEFEVSDAGEEYFRAVFILNINKTEKPLAIITEHLPAAMVNRDYEANLEAEGSALPYIWSLVNCSLPQGLDIDDSTGEISGIPEITGDFSLHIQVEDDRGNTVSKNITLSIKNVPDPVTGFIACSGNGKIGLAWANPGSADFALVKIFRSVSGYPLSPDEGELVYSGTDDNIVDAGLVNDVLYYYSAFAFDEEDAYGEIGEDSRAVAMPKAITLYGEYGPFADEVVSFKPLSEGGFGAGSMPQAVLGAPRGGGLAIASLDVVSLHSKINNDNGRTPPYGGSITLKFNDNIIVNGAGRDFTVFENVFYIGGDPRMRWMEPAIVSVSQDGNTFYTFPVDFVPHFDKENNINCYNPYCYSRGFAGINPVYSNGSNPDPANPAVSGGDSFDLSEISAKKLKWINYVRITSTGDNWLTDINGDKVRHNIDVGACSGADSSGFDLDAVCAVNY